MEHSYRVICTACPNEPVLGEAKLGPDEAMAWLVSHHAAQPHSGHLLRILVDGKDEVVYPGEREIHEIVIKCVECQTLPRVHTMKHRAPLVMIGALTIIMHTKHEGHALEIWIDGKKVAESPVAPA